jgi:hypothetical protein
MLGHITNAVYMLKHLYPTPVVLLTIDSSEVDATTGSRNLVKSWYHVRKAVVLTIEMKQKFIYDLAYVAANKNFTQGGWFNEDIRHVLIDQKDIGNIAIKAQMYCLIENQVYRIDAVERFSDGPFKGATAFTCIGVDEQPIIPVNNNLVMVFTAAKEL